MTKEQCEEFKRWIESELASVRADKMRATRQWRSQQISARDYDSHTAMFLTEDACWVRALNKIKELEKEGEQVLEYPNSGDSK